MQQKNHVALLSKDDESLQQIMLALAILFIFMGVIGVISCVYRIKGFQSARRKHNRESTSQSAASIQHQTEQVYKMKASTESSRADMQDSLKREVEELRAFQREVRGELGSLKTALEVLSQRRQRKNDFESQKTHEVPEMLSNMIDVRAPNEPPTAPRRGFLCSCGTLLPETCRWLTLLLLNN